MPDVLTGSDVLARQSFSEVAGLRIGFVGNHTSRLADGRLTRQAIQLSGSAELVKLFSPEHGAFGAEDDENVGDSIEPATGLPIYSLYGVTRKPTPEMLAGLDAMVFELQDVGARFYTYASTMLLCLEAAGESGIPLIVLDRPNPLGGKTPCEGPLPDADKHSFVVASNIPVRHGLTLGEIARLAQQERGLPRESLQVVPCENYTRGLWWDETGLPWVAPSPAMRSLETANVYPGVCLLEQTNVSVGRGTQTPFLVAGAPWIDSARWSRFINANAGGGVRAEPWEFVPTASKYAGEVCRGVRLRITSREVLAPVRLGIAMAAGLQNFRADIFELSGVNTLLASDITLGQLRMGGSVEQICESWQPEMSAWETMAGSLLIYR